MSTEKSQIDYSLLLLAHLICADDQIHVEEEKMLQALAQEVNASQGTKIALDAILSQSPEAPTVYDLSQCILPGKQIETLKQLLAMACIDGYISPLEEKFIKQISTLWNISDHDVESLRIDAEKSISSQDKVNRTQDDLSIGAYFLKGTETVLSRALLEKITQIAPSNIKRRIKKLQHKILLEGPEYDEAISKCAKIAQEDYDFIDRQIKESQKSLRRLRQNIGEVLDQLKKRVKNNGKNEALNILLQQLEATHQNLSSTIHQELSDLETSLKAKHRSLKYFSIAFMGRTKAGKSTLHAIVTNGGWDAIGEGSQRTTRYNRIYEWKNIRIIDTPGIGAPGGKSDEEIARSIIDEADVICYVVTNDGIQEAEFKFLKVIKERAKPLIVLLNIKNNLRSEGRLARFLKDPDKLFKKDGESGLDGHINRIKTYTAKQDYNSHFDIIPVMLLAAQMSKDETSEKSRKELFRLSQIDDFLDSIRMSVVEYGSIRRSQTFIGSTTFTIEKSKAWAKEQSQSYAEISEVINKKRQELGQNLQEAFNDVRADLKQQVRTIFSDLCSSANAFANAHWQDSEKVIQKEWEINLKRYDLEKKLENAVNVAQEALKNRAQDALEEVGTDLKMLASFRLDSNYTLGTSSSFLGNKKDIIKMGGMILIAAPVLALFPPFAALGTLLWSLSAAGGAITFFANKLKSKEKRERESVDHIYKQLSEQINSWETKTLEDVMKSLNSSFSVTSQSIDEYFECLSDNLEKVSECLDANQKELGIIIQRINFEYANRILEWITGTQQKSSRVQRSFGKQIEIWPSRPISAISDLEKFSQILQEEIIIH